MLVAHKVVGPVQTYRKCQSAPTGDTEARRKGEAKTQAAKHQAESTSEADAR